MGTDVVLTKYYTREMDMERRARRKGDDKGKKQEEDKGKRRERTRGKDGIFKPGRRKR